MRRRPGHVGILDLAKNFVHLHMLLLGRDRPNPGVVVLGLVVFPWKYFVMVIHNAAGRNKDKFPVYRHHLCVARRKVDVCGLGYGKSGENGRSELGLDLGYLQH